MGQNQLLQLVLAAIIVAISIFVGINLTVSSAEQANRDAIIFDLHQLSSIARNYYRRPVILGGGSHSFANFKIPKVLALNENGTITHTNISHTPNHIHFEGIGKETGKDGINPIKIEVRTTIDEIKLTEHN